MHVSEKYVSNHGYKSVCYYMKIHYVKDNSILV